MAIVYADGAIVDGNGTGRMSMETRLPKARAGAPQRQGQGGGAAGELPGRQCAGLGRDLAGNGAAPSREAGDRVDGRLCSQRRLLYLLSRGCDRGRPDDAFTGSIGVYGMYLDAGQRSKDKLGITFDGCAATPRPTWVSCGPSPRRTVGRHARRG